MMTIAGEILSICIRIPFKSFSLDRWRLSGLTLILFALIATCSSLSSAETYKIGLLTPEQICNANVDLPTPGLPPKRSNDPGKRPPPSTLSASIMLVVILSPGSDSKISLRAL